VGTAVALRWVPRGWQGRFRTFDRGLKPGVSLAAGAACEGALSFLINLVVLWSLATRCGPPAAAPARSKILSVCCHSVPAV